MPKTNKTSGILNKIAENSQQSVRALKPKAVKISCANIASHIIQHDHQPDEHRRFVMHKESKILLLVESGNFMFSVLLNIKVIHHLIILDAEPVIHAFMILLQLTKLNIRK